jgi:CRISPR/Cas system-associated exonuclease Cas4 (RecB family)
LGLEAVVTRVLYATQKDLTYFAPVSSLPGFARSLANTLNKLRLAGVSEESLALAGPPGPDLAKLLSAYKKEIAERFLSDLAEMFAFAQLSMRQSPAGSGMPLLLLDPAIESRAHAEFIRALALRSPAVLAAVSQDARRIEELLGVAAHSLDTEPAANVLEHLRRNLFSPAASAYPASAGFEIFSSPGEGLETVEIARRILLLSQEGFAFDQMAILARNPDRYQAVIEEALRRARIPAYFSRGTVRPDPAGRAFLALLACASEKLSASRFAEYLSLGQVPRDEQQEPPEWVAPQDDLLVRDAEPVEETPDRPERKLNAPWGWEKLLVDAAVIGGRERWERRLRGLDREMELRIEGLGEDDDALRAQIGSQLERLRELAGFALPLIQILDSLPRAAPWKDWLEALAALANKALRHPEGVLAVLAEFEPMGDVGPAGIEEVLEVLSDRLRFLRAEPIQRRWGCVFVGSIEEARGAQFRVVFLPGLAEGLFPQRVLEDPLLLDQYHAGLDSKLPLREDGIHRERELLRLAVAAAGERFIASYPRMDVAEARPRVPSFYALELPRALYGTLPPLAKFETEAREAAPARLNWPAPKDPGQAIDDAEYDLAILASAMPQGSGARFVVEANPHLARSLRARFQRWKPSWKESDGLITRDPAALEALAGHRLTERPWSPSSLELFAACPYKFALHGIHRLRPRAAADPLQYLDPLTRGALFHEIQYSLLGALRERELLPLNADRLPAALAEADASLDRIASRYAEELAPAIPRVWASEMEDLRTDLRGWLQQVAQNDTDFTPLHFEFAFGLPSKEGRDQASIAEEIVLAEGVRLRGSIDLVERDGRTGALRVTDHKTGKPPERVPAYTGGGRVLQPLLYALAAQNALKSSVESGRLFYATQRGSYAQIRIPLSDRSRAFLAKLLQNIDGAVATGFLPPLPEKDACKFCDYRPVCGPYEELRLREKDLHDERLDPVHEIRGFL